jgi:hypothetical protein
MKEKTTKITSFFPVELILCDNGKVLLRDYQENVWTITNKDNSNITEDQYNLILENQMGFWEIAHKFNLTLGDIKV